jgi:hypothetical protein
MKVSFFLSAMVMVLILNSAGLFAQEKFLEGYIIGVSGARYEGMIGDGDWDKNPESIVFRDQDGTMHYYNPKNVKEFGVSGNIYVSAAVEYDPTPDDLTSLTSWSELQLVRDTVFLKVMARGQKNLYQLKGQNEKLHFYTGNDGVFDLLVYKRFYRKDADSSRYVAVNNKFIGQLILYFIDCPVLKDKIYSSKYQAGSLLKLFEAWYDECSESSPVYLTKIEKVGLEFGVIAGASLSTIKFQSTTNAWPALTEGDFGISVRPALGVSLNVVLPKAWNKWALYNELTFTSYRFQDEYTEMENENNYTVINTELAYTYLKLFNALRFTYPVGKTLLFAQAGISNGFVIYSLNQQLRDIHFYNQQRTEEVMAVEAVRSHEFGFFGGAGGRLGRFSLEFRYERGTGISEFIYLTAPTNRYYLLLGFRL